MFRRILAAFLAIIMILACAWASATENAIYLFTDDYPVTQNGTYTSMEEVAVYLFSFGRLPSNFVTKKKAESLGWSNRLGNLTQVSPGSSIGGDYFGNYEGNVPAASGRKWTECDINYVSGYRNGERIVFSNDGLIYYSNDHYATFTRVIVEKGSSAPAGETASLETAVDVNGQYTTKEDIAAYIHAYGKLPSNFITRDEAKQLGWSSKKDNLADVAPGRAIGGDVFQNKEHQLPEENGRVWRECDIPTASGKRSKKRIVYSSDGLIYYTSDNHKTFTRLY